MAANSTGTEIDCTAQTVELLVEQKSMSSAALRARTACALRNERRVKTLVPEPNRMLSRATVGLATNTLLTISIATVPSLRSSLTGRDVLLIAAISGSVTNRR